MLTLIGINKAINDKIKSGLLGTSFSTVPLIANDVIEPIIRPSIKIQIEGTRNGKLNANHREKSLTVRVYFFASDLMKYKIENLKVQDILEDALLEGLYVNGAYLPIEYVEADVTDTVLILEFKLYVVELMDAEQAEYMKELELKGDIK